MDDELFVIQEEDVFDFETESLLIDKTLCEQLQAVRIHIVRSYHQWKDWEVILGLLV